ncbi:MAG: Brp/Blh family beta-carotene 15,15'-dioxygenase [Balneolales bacterium]|nr:Brp/Blh family beta-carotene 15,15'-dioxygenase [Balneolales bacterium]
MKPTLWNTAALFLALIILFTHLAQPEAGFFLGTAFALIGLMVIGIPHGSLDHVISEKTAENKKTFSLIRFLGLYLLTMALYAGVWVWLPGFSLLFFLVLSAWHFGETDLDEPRFSFSFFLKHLSYMLYGSMLLFGLLANDPAQTVEILSSLLPEAVALQGFVALIGQYPVLAYTEFFALAFRFALIKQNWYDYLRLLVILAIALYLPLLEGFLLYFCHHHAWLNLVRVHERLYHQSSSGLYSMVKDMMPFSVISVVGLILLVASSPLWLSHLNPVLLFFILISVLTLPHAGIMSQFYSKHRKKKAATLTV